MIPLVIDNSDKNQEVSKSSLRNENIEIQLI